MLWFCRALSLLAGRVSQPSSQKNGRGIVFFFHFPRCVSLQSRKATSECVGLRTSTKDIVFIFDHSPQHHVISPYVYICSFVAAFVLGVVYIMT